MAQTRWYRSMTADQIGATYGQRLTGEMHALAADSATAAMPVGTERQWVVSAGHTVIWARHCTDGRWYVEAAVKSGSTHEDQWSMTCRPSGCLLMGTGHHHIRQTAADLATLAGVGR